MQKWKRYVAGAALAAPIAMGVDLTSIILNGRWIM